MSSYEDIRRTGSLARLDLPGVDALLKRTSSSVYASCIQVVSRGGHWRVSYHTCTDDGVTNLRVLGFLGTRGFANSNLWATSSRARRPR